MEAEAVTAEAVGAAARAWLGIPWRHQGRSARGVDCAGLVVLVARELGLADYDKQTYGRRPEGQGFDQHFRAAMAGIRLPEAGPGGCPRPPACGSVQS